jgi:hypothetical protein
LPKGKDTDSTFIVGWDPPLGTFFAQEEAFTVYEGEDVIWWIGYTMREIPTLADLRYLLLVKKGIVIPKDIDDLLRADQEAPWTPGPLQQALGFTGKETHQDLPGERFE